MKNLYWKIRFLLNGFSTSHIGIGGGEEPAPSQSPVYDELVGKKGLKSNEDLAKIYVDAEKEGGRRQSVLDTVKTNLEKHGYTMNDKGDILDKQGQVVQPQAQPAAQPQPGQPGYVQPAYSQPQSQVDAYGNPVQQQDPIYDLNGNAITNPIDRQLAMMPLSQRLGFVTNTILDQREKQQGAAFNNDRDVLSKPEAKGFEADVRTVMAQVPLAQRADKKAWDDALLRVKGMKFDNMIKSAGGDAIQQFINKDGAQTPVGQGAGAGGGSKLSVEQRVTYDYYKANFPAMFKDEDHFLSRCSNTGG